MSTDLSIGSHSFHYASISPSGGDSSPSATATAEVKEVFYESGGEAFTSLVDPASLGKSDVGKDGYTLAFSDEFDGFGEVNPNRWNTQLRWDGDWNGERYEYRVINQEN